MDKKIEKSKFRPLQIAMFTLIPLAIWGGFKMLKTTTGIFQISKKEITIKEVTKGDFQDVIIINGTVEPLSSVLVAVPEGGIIQEVYAEDGSMVKKGQPLFKVSNPNALLNYMTHETSIIEQINNMRNTKLTIESNKREMISQLLDMEFNMEKSKLNFQTDSTLYKQAVAVARRDFQNTELEYKYYQKKKHTLDDFITKENERNDLQLQNIDTSIELMNRNLAAMRENINNFYVKSPINGRLSSFDPELGRSYASGTSIGKIDLLNGYKVSCMVAEFYISKIRIGQRASLNIAGKDYWMEVAKVLPEVSNGHYEVVLKFVDDKPSDLRRGQSLSVRLQLSGKVEAVLLPRGTYFQSTGGQWVYVLNNNNEAIKRSIKVGRQNPTHYEVVSGLDEGERVITSSYEFYKHHDRLELSE